MTLQDVAAAAERIAGRVRRTPVLAVEPGTFGGSDGVHLKLEQLQVSGSFKARGAFNLLLASQVPGAGVVAASGGNFGLAVAYAARELGVPARIFVPEVSSPAKVARLRALGADVVQQGAYYADALERCRREVAESGALEGHAYDHPLVVAGAGTTARELADQVPGLDTVLVAVGGAGLIGGMASWWRGEVRLVGVETHGTRTLHAALEAGQPVDVEVSGAAADALGARRVGALGFAAASRWVDRVVLVGDDDLHRARARLWHETRLVCELATAAPLAALATGAYVPEPGERVAVVVCGANTDPAQMREVVAGGAEPRRGEHARRHGSSDP